MIVADAHQHAAMFVGAMPIALPQRINRLVKPRALAVPHTEDAVVETVVVIVSLLGAPNRGHCQMFVGAGPKRNVMFGQQFTCSPQFLVDGGHGRAAITRHKAAGITTGGEIPLPLQQQQAHHGLTSSEMNQSIVLGVAVSQRDFMLGHGCYRLSRNSGSG